MMKNVVVLGAGSAGLFAALTLKIKIPNVTVHIVRSPELGIIGVGESTTPNLPFHLFEYLGISPRRFYELAEPTWKMGIHFLWGPRKSFEYTFEQQMDVRSAGLARANGYYAKDEFDYFCLQSALMTHGKAFPRSPNGSGPEIPAWHAFHLENPKLVRALEVFCRELGVQFTNGKMSHAERGPLGVAAIVLEDGQRIEGDFFVDASGFRSELLGKAMEEPYISFCDSLFNDRAVVGSWERTDEPILPYTTAETMDCGWCWRIEHERSINRGYVYSSSAISDDEARAEFMRKNPKAKTWDHVVKFRTGRYERGWVQNVLGVGNACGFVEPLESTALMVICGQMEVFCDLVTQAGYTPTAQKMFNADWAATWDEVRDFLTLHFWSNTRLDTLYWQRCRNDTDISRLKPLLDFYRENGPAGFCRKLIGNTQFGLEGFLVMLVGNRVPYECDFMPTAVEINAVEQGRMRFKNYAITNGLTVEESLACIRHPNWRWTNEQ
jgi:tryptophan halogenase